MHKRHVKGLAAHTVSAVSQLPVIGFPHSPDMIHAHMDVTGSGMQVLGRSVHKQVKDWHHLDSRKQKVSKPFFGTIPWVNLVFGESAALLIQGIAQSNNASTAYSFGIGVTAALVVELLATMPGAMQHKEKRPAEAVVNASLTGFWLGGAMGAANEKLPAKQALFPIGAYMIYGIGLAAIGELNNSAEKLVENAGILLIFLFVWGIVKKSDEFFEHEGMTERIANKSVASARKLRAKRKRNLL